MATSTENAAGGRFDYLVLMLELLTFSPNTISLCSKEGLWYIWVYLLETETCKAEDYTCTISIRR